MTVTEVVRYEYDAWGNPISTTGTLAGTIGKRNPFRYRGYYWDEETGMYYLESRYYDPEIRRFIRADSVVITSLAGTNLYMYCGNNPVNMTDPSGKSAIDLLYSLRDQLQELQSEMGTVGALFGLGALILSVGLLAYENRHTISKIGNAALSLASEGINTGTLYALKVQGSILDNSLTLDMIRRVQGKQRNNKFHFHHVVPKGDRRAFLARVLLFSGGIGVNDPVNLVPLTATFHSSLHTNLYFVWVDFNMIYANYLAKDRETLLQRKEYFSTQLVSMSNFLVAIDKLTQAF